MDQLHEETIFASRNSASRNSASRNSASRNSASRNSASRNPASRNSASRNPASRNPASRNSISRNLHIKKSKLCAQSSADKTAHEEDVFESNPGEGSLHPVRVPREERREEGLPGGPGHQGGEAAPGCHQRECRGRSAARCPRSAATSACTAGGVPRGARGGVQQHQPARAPQEECREVRGSFLHFLQILSSSCQNITGERRGSLSEYKIISSQVPEDSTNCLYFPCILS